MKRFCLPAGSKDVANSELDRIGQLKKGGVVAV